MSNQIKQVCYIWIWKCWYLISYLRNSFESFEFWESHVLTEKLCVSLSVKNWLSDLVHITCYRICARGLSATIRYHNKWATVSFFIPVFPIWSLSHCLRFHSASLCFSPMVSWACRCKTGLKNSMPTFWHTSNVIHYENNI